MNDRSLRVWVCGVLLLTGARVASAVPPCTSSDPCDIVIRNGHIVDGTGSPWYQGDVAIRQGRIVAIGRLGNIAAKRTIDAHGRVVAPGFIDMLGQSDLTILVDPRLPSKITQGITTEITGEGESMAPQSNALIRRDHAYYAHYHIKPDWHTYRGYFARLQKQGIGINVADYVGATQVREMVIGDADRAPTPEELKRMKALVDQAMEEGAMGVSTALEYAPAPYAKTDELIALAREAAKYGGIYATHMRSEGDAIMKALKETARIAREARIPVEIFHIKVAGVRNWGEMPQIVSFIDKSRSQGLDITADTYAYTAWENGLAAFIPPWVHDGGKAKMLERLRDPAVRARVKKELDTPSTAWDNEWDEIPGPQAILVSAVQNPKLLPLQGKTIAEIAKSWGEDPKDAIFDLLLKDDGFTYVSVFGMKESDVELALKQPWVSIDNDASGTSPTGILGKEHPHPRAYATFPRILRKYVRQQKLLTLPDAIRKFSALAAQRMGLTDRGVLKVGMWADIVVFDPNTVTDHATYAKPNQFSTGMDYVLVNGVPVIDNDKMTGALPGKVLRGPGYTGNH